jgi:hypothetical protein
MVFVSLYNILNYIIKKDFYNTLGKYPYEELFLSLYLEKLFLFGISKGKSSVISEIEGWELDSCVGGVGVGGVRNTKLAEEPEFSGVGVGGVGVGGVGVGGVRNTNLAEEPESSAIASSLYSGFGVGGVGVDGSALALALANLLFAIAETFKLLGLKTLLFFIFLKLYFLLGTSIYPTSSIFILFAFLRYSIYFLCIISRFVYETNGKEPQELLRSSKLHVVSKK